MLPVAWATACCCSAAARVQRGRAVLQAVGFADRSAPPTCVVTGEGCFDWQSLRGKVVAGVAQAALAEAVPAVVIAGQDHGRPARGAWPSGSSGTYAVAERPNR